MGSTSRIGVISIAPTRDLDILALLVRRFGGAKRFQSQVLALLAGYLAWRSCCCPTPLAYDCGATRTLAKDSA